MASFGKDRRFNAGLQWRMLGRTGWAGDLAKGAGAAGAEGSA